MKQSTLTYSFYCVISCFILGACSSCSTERKNFNDWHRMNLKDEVRQIDITSYSSYQDFMKKNNSQKSFTRFNKKGFITKTASFGVNEQIFWMKYLYKEDSVWINETIEVNNRNEQPQTYWLYELDELGNQVKITSILLDSSINFKIDVSYTSKGLAESIRYSQQKNPMHVPCRIEKIYDENGLIKEEHAYRYNPILKSCDPQATKSVFTLNKYGDIDREVMYNAEGIKAGVNSYEYLYDKHGNWTQKLSYEGDLVTSIVQHSYIYAQDRSKIKD